MAHPPEIRQKVRNAYVHDRLSLEQAANLADVSYHTARSWKKKAEEDGDDWDKARQAARIADSGMGDLTKLVLTDFTRQFQATLEQLKGYQEDPLGAAKALGQLADSYTKMIAATAKGNPDLNRQGVALEVIKLFSDFIQVDYPQHLHAFAEVLEPFGAYLQEQMMR